MLFCDLVGFTAASESADPEEVQARVAPYHRRVRERIEAFGGTVEKFIGDAVMAVFGAPVAHEDDAERAVRAGLAILEALAELNDDPGLSLSVRVGVNTGEAVVALGARPESGEGMVTGDVVNTAARIQSQAPVDGVAVGEGTYHATERVFEYAPLESISAKGKSEPVAVWRAVAPRARFGSDVIRSMKTPLVGRDLDLTLLRGTFDKVAAEQAAQLITVVGEPGVGKSRLVAELFAYVDGLPQVVRWRQGRCLPYGDGITFWALGEIVKAHLGVLESDPPEEAQAKLERALPGGADAPWLRARLLPLLGIDPGIAATRDESFAAWRRFLESTAEDRPAVLVFEDIHWADEALLAFLEHLADWAEGVALLVVCTARPELYERHPAWGAGLRNAATVSLSPLSDADTARLVSALLEQAVLPAETQQLLLDRAGGNPLYAEEFVRMLRDRELLDHQGRLSDGGGIAFPESLQALIAARLDTLPPDRKSLLQDAAVIGKVFWSGAVAAMGDRAAGDVEQALHELARKELVRPFRQSSMEGEKELGFWHALVRDVAYGQVPRAERAAKHVKAVEWLEHKAGERVEDLAEVLAFHTGEAISLAEATGDDRLAAQLAPAARRYALLAGERALGLDTGKGVELLERALTLTPADDPEHARVLLRFADAASQAGRYSEAADACEQALAGFRVQGDVEGAAEALDVLGRVRSRQGDQKGAVTIAEEAVALMETLPPGQGLVAALGQLAASLVVDTQHPAAIAAADRALSLAAELGLPLPARALAYRGAARCLRGDRGGLAELEQARDLLAEAGAGALAQTAMHNLAVALWELDGIAAALPKMAEARAFGLERGITGLATATAGIEAAWLMDAGKLEVALAQADELVPKLEESGQAQTLLRMREIQARVHDAMGDQQRAAEAATAALAGARELGDHRSLTIALLALESGAAGDDELHGLLYEVAGDVPLHSDHDFVARLPGLLRCVLELGDLDLATQLLEGVDPIGPLYVNSLASARAELAQARGEYTSAADLFAGAADGWRRFGSGFEEAYALLGQGRCLAALDDPTAGQPLWEARRMFDEMGARARIAECDTLIAQASRLSS